MSQVSYYLYDSTGAIVETGRNEQANIVVTAGTTLGMGEATPFTHYVKNGALTEYTAAQAAARASVPAYSKWDATAMAWVDARDLPTLKMGLVSTVTTTRDTKTFGDNTVITIKISNVDKTFPTTDANIKRYNRALIGWQAAISLGSLLFGTIPSSKTFDLVDGTAIALTLAQLQMLVAKIEEREDGNRATARPIIAAVNAAVTKAAAITEAAAAQTATWNTTTSTSMRPGSGS